MIRKLFSFTPWMIAIAVAGSLIAAFTLIIYGFLTVLETIWDVVQPPHGIERSEATHLSIEFIELIDIFLIGVILLIVALGLYQLFIDEKTKLPRWLVVRNLDQLKHKLVGVICVVLGVNFVSQAAEWDGSKNIVYYGAAIAFVLLALVALLVVVDRTIKDEIQLLDEGLLQRELDTEEDDEHRLLPPNRPI